MDRSNTKPPFTGYRKEDNLRDPNAHVRALVVRELPALFPAVAIASLLGCKEEAEANVEGLRRIMDRFPEIDWGSGPRGSAPGEDDSMLTTVEALESAMRNGEAGGHSDLLMGRPLEDIIKTHRGAKAAARFLAEQLRLRSH